ncbi:GNAT family N-acetyltransferase [Flavobacterium sp. MC2016-06]|jgi:predicted GNAT family acetyltransferase|uniref:GNAT family N-acetyltransferase n=1 Tax=Flavobacterium sp. MC2016-06 TaxID=2676308 RepID=UPI0012BB15BB|nr:GNAT family N-acetyltransferase [Flavobacterium sp. MC2016-06]MBU3859443.1 N-acetyltransferase [Flavobacterium sp. MC2016-06]
MEIKQINDIKRGYFEAVEDGKEAGKMTYTWAGDDKFIIDHTEVSEDFAGKGVGKKLLMAVVDYARNNNLKIIPLCPFAKSVFDKTEEIRDVLFS